ncbi:MAG: prolipoprotein diacylglyceryl transferase [Nitrospiraceae bacterium]|nr:prolipoprotein diacylglyceryl transferase [Nitrospiraceae bacterium]
MLAWYHTIPYPNIDPVFLHLGPLQFRWYGLMYLIGLTLAYFIIGARAKAQNLPLNKDQVYDMIVYAAVGVFTGGRLGYVLFYNLSYYLENPLKILAVWEGGMSFHGGLIGTIIALVLFAKRRGIGVLTIADLAAGVTPVGLGLGRIGNFINGELFGRPTDVDWCMVFPGGGPVCRHPSQLYESALEGALLFTVLWLIARRMPPAGTVFGSFLIGYGICRFIVEFFREPDAQIGFLFGTLSMGQLLSLPMLVGGAVILVIAAQRRAPEHGTV